MRIVRAWLGGAKKAGEKIDWLAFQSEIEAWGKFEGCREAHIIGRRGWERALDNFEHKETVLRKTL
jgi:hypothetical protein